MASHYNPQLHSWFMTKARHRISGYYSMSGRELIGMGYRRC